MPGVGTTVGVSASMNPRERKNSRTAAMISARFSIRPRYAASVFQRFQFGICPDMVITQNPVLADGILVREWLFHDVRQERHRPGPLDGLGQHALMLGTDAAPAARHDLPVGRGVAAKRVRILVIDGPDTVDAEA